MKKVTNILLFISCWLIVGNLTAQETVTQNETVVKVMVIGSIKKDKILLRWSMNTPLSWRKANRYGYRLERYTIIRGNTTLPQPEKLVLSERIVPEPIEMWESIIETNDNAAIMAQALYGESFEIEAGDGLSNIINLSREQEQRFSFGLLAAEQDFEVAQKAGLGYVDITTKPDEKYIYKVVSLIPSEEMQTEEGGVFLGLRDYEPLPKPLDFAGVFNDKNVILTWNKKLLVKTYTSYFVERSVDNINFERRDAKPFMNINNEEFENTDRAFYTDSIANDKTYYYRIKGMTPFGEIGPASEVVSGEGKKVLKYVPHLISKKIISDNEVVLKWEFPKEGLSELKNFNLKRSDTEGGFFKTVKQNISPQTRETNYVGLKSSNYFKIEAVDKNNNTRESFAMLVQPIDSIPPAKPTGLTGVIDSTGVVKLSWNANVEKDILGYRIYRGNTKTEELTQLTIEPTPENTFKDSIIIKNLNPNVFYKVIALDNRYNMSASSDILTIKKPDVIPPTSPVFKDYKIEKNTVFLKWASSSSIDVAAHYIYKKEGTKTDWKLVKTITDNTNNYKDKKIKEGIIYTYTIVAKDQSGLESEPAPPVTLIIPKTGLKPKVKGFYASADIKNGFIDISWRYKEEDVSEFQLYRANGENPLRFFKTSPSNKQRIVDNTGLIINTNYTYLIRAVFNDGTLSEYSKTTVKY